jgi:hypothetical protein
MISDAQNNLPFAGAENTFRSQGFVWILKWISDEREQQKARKRRTRPKKTQRPSATISFNERKTPVFLPFLKIRYAGKGTFYHVLHL